MKNKIILFYPKTMYEVGINYYHVPYSVLCLLSLLDANKYEFVIIDHNIQEYSFEHYENVLCVGVSVMIGHQIRDGISISKDIKSNNPDIPIIWGGALATMLPDETISNEYVDIIVRGQGEVTFKEIVEHLYINKIINNILGISYKKGNKIIHNKDRQFQNINEFPSYRAIYHNIKVDRYIRNDININSKTISYHSSQGCRYNCGFCCESKLWNKQWSGFSLSQIKNDIDYLVELYKINGVKLYDSEFFIDRRRAIEFSNYLIKENKNIKWGAAINPNNLLKLKKDEIVLFSNSGLARLMIGMESITNNKQNMINKQLLKTDVNKICQICNDSNISVCLSFIIGFPNDTEKIIEETISLASRVRSINQTNEVQINFYSPYPGTPLYNLAIKNGFVAPSSLTEWSWYDYRRINTPWIADKYEFIVRQFNEENYPFMSINNNR